MTTQQVFQNGNMSCKVISIIGHDLNNPNDNHAIIYRIACKDYAVVRDLTIKDGQGSWWFSYAYDIDNLTEATIELLKKVQ